MTSDSVAALVPGESDLKVHCWTDHCNLPRNHKLVSKGVKVQATSKNQESKYKDRTFTSPLHSLSFQTVLEYTRRDDYRSSFLTSKRQGCQKRNERRQRIISKITRTHNFKRCSKSPTEEGIGPLMLLEEVSLP